MVYRIIIDLTTLVLIASIVPLATPVTKSSNQLEIIINESIGSDNSYYNEPTSYFHFTPDQNKEENITTVNRDEINGKIISKSTKSSSSRTLNRWHGGFMSAREIDNLSRARDINVNVLSNINLAEIIRAYRGEPKTPEEGSRRSGSWFWW